MSAIKTTFKDPLYTTGIGLLVVSLALFCMPVAFPYICADSMGLFFIHFGITVIYFFTLLVSGRLKHGRGGLHLLMILLMIALVSAYALNREMLVFQKSVSWFSALLVVGCANILLFGFSGSLPRGMKIVMSFILGITIVAFGYLTLYLFPIYLLSGLVGLVLGISLHAFVPVLFVIYIIAIIRRESEVTGYLISFISGASLAVTFCIAFIIYWCVLSAGINQNYRRSTVRGDGDLPNWVRVAQGMPDNWLSERMLKTELVYSIADLKIDELFWEMPSANFDEEKKHDPLIMMGSLFSGKLNIPDDARIKILEAMYNSRHQAQERLWRGDNLATEEVDTDIRLWPDLRIAYTELNITVSNFGHRRSWSNGEEGIYTFHLPEGGVVTSLSLWINAKEAKGVLTTKAKADSAYKTIVGVEQHDPSVVHWQEGNTVTVRVYPVQANESRMFKIGITAPLTFRNNKMTYEPVYFDGPASNKAVEDLSVSFVQKPEHIVASSSLGFAGNGKYVRTGKYRTDWKIEFDALPLKDRHFSFNGNSYTIMPWQKKYEPFQPSAIYLDINATWSAEECDKAYELVKDRQVFIASSSDELDKITPENKELLFGKLREKHFSLFPFYKIGDTTGSLVISKSGAASPAVHDLKGSFFSESLNGYFTRSSGIKFYNIGQELSPYLKTLKEFRALNYEQGDLNDLQQLLASHSFPANMENDQQVVVENAGISIVRSADTLPSNAPDHLMRLFAYNHILKKSGTGLLKGAVIEDELVAEAEQAYVVSPVSSLVVLETQADYDRFDIKKSKSSLENASIKSKGAVPEPHEWALILIVVFTLLYVRFKKSFKLSR